MWAGMDDQSTHMPYLTWEIDFIIKVLIVHSSDEPFGLVLEPSPLANMAMPWERASVRDMGACRSVHA